MNTNVNEAKTKKFGVMSPNSMKAFLIERFGSIQTFASQVQLPQNRVSMFIHRRPKVAWRGTSNYKVAKELLKSGLTDSQVGVIILEMERGA